MSNHLKSFLKSGFCTYPCQTLSPQSLMWPDWQVSENFLLRSKTPSAMFDSWQRLPHEAISKWVGQGFSRQVETDKKSHFPFCKIARIFYLSRNWSDNLHSAHLSYFVFLNFKSTLQVWIFRKLYFKSRLLYRFQFRSHKPCQMSLPPNLRSLIEQRDQRMKRFKDLRGRLTSYNSFPKGWPWIEQRGDRLSHSRNLMINSDNLYWCGCHNHLNFESTLLLLGHSYDIFNYTFEEVLARA